MIMEWVELRQLEQVNSFRVGLLWPLRFEINAECANLSCIHFILWAFILNNFIIIFILVINKALLVAGYSQIGLVQLWISLKEDFNAILCAIVFGSLGQVEVVKAIKVLYKPTVEIRHLIK